MKEYQKEASDLQLKMHGNFATIDFNNINEKFFMELEKAGVDYDEFQESFSKVSDFYSKGYEENKEVCDNSFVEEVISDIKRLMEIASMIE